MQVWAPGMLGEYVTTIVCEVPGAILPYLMLRLKDVSFSSSFILLILKLAMTKLWFLRVMTLESVFPTVIYSKLSFSSLIFTNGNFPIPLILSTV